MPKAKSVSSDTPRRRGKGAVAIIDTPAERGLLLRALLYSPKDLVAGLAQGLREPLVLRRDGGERALRVGEPELETAGVTGRLTETAAQVSDLGLEEPHLAHQLVRGTPPGA